MESGAARAEPGPGTRGLGAWLRWEMSRHIELTPFLRFIIVERFFKGTVLVLGGIAIIVAASRTNLVDLAHRLQTDANLEPGRHLWRRLVEGVLQRFGGHADAIAVGAILYGLLEGFEGVGLILRRRWAEYVVLLATAAFLPVEVTELVRRPSAFKAIALVVNAAIVVYLVWRKRLFLERPGHVTAEAVD